MKGKIKLFMCILVTFMSLMPACTAEESPYVESSSSENTIQEKPALDFIAQFTPEQLDNIETDGCAFLPEQQKDSWNATIDRDIPTRFGLFDSPLKRTRAVGISGSYPAQYWTMIRVKVHSDVSSRIREQLNEAVMEIEEKTNVRFYNCQEDNEYYESGSIKIKLPHVMLNINSNNTKIEGSGNYGLVGGEQFIYCSTDLNNTSKYSDEEVRAFLMHALCNAAGMFNEQQRNDRDSYVKIYSENILDNCKPCFEKQTKNYTTSGNFDIHSITMASSYSYSKNGQKTIEQRGGAAIPRNSDLSTNDINFLNDHYLPYVARDDNYVELDKTVYYNGRVLTEAERLDLQNQMNALRGLTGTPPPDKVKKRKPW